MADVTAEVLIQSTFAGGGVAQARTALEGVEKATRKVEAAEKSAAQTTSATQAAFAKLAKQIEQMGEAGAERSAEKVARLRVELRKLEQQAQEAGEEIQDLGKAHKGLDDATKFVQDMRVEQVRMNDSITLSTKSATLQQQLFDANAGKLGQYGKAVGVVGAAFAGGFATGLKIAEKAGVDTTLMMEALDGAVTSVAKGINAIVGGPFRALGEALGNTGDAIEEDLLGPLPVVAEKMREAQAATAAFEEALQRLKTANEQFSAIAKSEAAQQLLELVQGFRDTGGAAAYARGELDGLRLQVRRLIEQGALAAGGFDESFLKSFGLIGETAEESAQRVEAARKKQEQATRDAAKAEADAAKAAKQAEDDRMRSAEARGAAAAAAAAEELRLGVLRTENEMNLRGVTDETVRAYQAARQTEIEATARSAEEKLAAEMELAKEIARIRLNLLETNTELSEEEKTRQRAALEELLASEQTGADTRAQITTKLADFTKQTATAVSDWEKMTAEQRKQAVVGATQAGIGALSAAFGEQKEFAIAQAVINTYQSATGAYNALAAIPIVGPALGVAAAAAAIVAGLKNVQQIRSAEPAGAGGGEMAPAPSFDVPANDAAARFAGAMSARDMAGHFGDGFRRELLTGVAHTRTGNTAGPANDSRGGGDTFNINGGGFMAPREMIKGITRDQRKFRSVVESRAVRSRSRVVR